MSKRVLALVLAVASLAGCATNPTSTDGRMGGSFEIRDVAGLPVNVGLGVSVGRNGVYVDPSVRVMGSYGKSRRIGGK